MNATFFIVGGALTGEHATIYIERQADRDVLEHLRAMDYLLVIEPRQQGKSSLINHLMHLPTLEDVALVYVDVTTPDRSTEATWYQTLCPRILLQLHSFIPHEQWPTIPQNCTGWREFLWKVAMSASAAHKRVLIALDEIGAVTFPGATEFFSVLRNVYGARQVEIEFKWLTFLLSGAFHPRNLIKDNKISPFNVAQRVRLVDFALFQVRELVGKGNWSNEQAAVLAERIYYWADGQPYLTQLLCSYLGPDATLADVDAGVERLRREDENHLPPMLERLSSDETLCQYTARVLAGERIKFYPRENRRQTQLELLGVIKEGPEGFCIVRNRIYERVLIESGILGKFNLNKPSDPPSGKTSQTSLLEGIMDIKRGLGQLRICIEQQASDRLSEFHTLEDRMDKNEHAERFFGSSENTRNERSQIIFALNEMALECCGISFNDLSEGKQPLATPIPSPTDRQSDEISKRLQHIEAKLDQGRVEDRQVAGQLLDALSQDQVTKTEASQIVAELRDWMLAVQQSGLPLNAEVREALDALIEHKGSGYQYLQLAIPLIPGILSYNVEVGSEHKVDLKSIWERIKVRFGKDAKGQGVSGSGKTYHGIGKAWAVLVGINHYGDTFIPSLKVCVDDVTAIHQSLSGSYEVARLLTDATSEHLPTRANILGELSTVAQSTSEDDLLLFYFSGHGMARDGESYLLARDTRLSALKHTALAMKDVREIIAQSPAHAKVIVLDACHSGASIGKAEPTMTPEFIQRVFEQAEGMAVLASCKEDQQSWEWSEKQRSVFTYYLLDALTGKADFESKGFVSVSDVSNYVTDGVKTWAAQHSVPQTPTLQYTAAGDIILLRYAH